jgi:hypothetical protein
MGKQAFRPVFLKLADNKRKDRTVSIAATGIACPHALPAGAAAGRAGAFFLQVAGGSGKMAEE